MSKSFDLNIKYPMRGVSRSVAYCMEHPHATPGAFNMRPSGTLESRKRGGSRPGLVKVVATNFTGGIASICGVTYVDGSGTRQSDIAVIAGGDFYLARGETVSEQVAYLTTDGGVQITDEEGVPIVFDSSVSETNPLTDSGAFQLCEKGGKIFISDSHLKVHDPITGTVDVVPNAPAGLPIVCTYEERIVLSGADHMFYASAQADESDWDAGAEMGNIGRAVFGHVGVGGKIGDKINALVPWNDKVLVVGTEESIWAIYGNLVTGEKVNISPFVGIIGPNALTVTPGGKVIFLSRTGLYLWQIGSNAHPEEFSANVIPEELVNVDTETTTVLMQYDHAFGGVHLFLTPADGVGKHWWIDLDTMSLWPVVIPEGMQPVALCKIGDEVVYGCKDGYIRKFSDAATSDDGTDIDSHILLGPFRISGNDKLDGMIMEMHGVLADNAGGVTWRIFTGDSAEAATDAAVSAVNDEVSGGIASGYRFSGTWS